MKQLLRILTVHSGRDLIKYKSFFLLIFGLILLDRAIHHYVPLRKPDLGPGKLYTFSLQAAAYIFEELPLKLREWLTDRRTLAMIAGLILLRILAEILFVALIPLGSILFIDHFWVRLPLAALSATPFYAYLKMATFKFFLFTYGRFNLVREEYPEYYI